MTFLTSWSSQQGWVMWPILVWHGRRFSPAPSPYIPTGSPFLPFCTFWELWVPHQTLEAVKMMRNKEKTLSTQWCKCSFLQKIRICSALPPLLFFTKLSKYTWSSIFCTGIRRKRSDFPVDRKVYHSCFKERGKMSDWGEEILQVFILMA